MCVTIYGRLATRMVQVSNIRNRLKAASYIHLLSSYDLIKNQLILSAEIRVFHCCKIAEFIFCYEDNELVELCNDCVGLSLTFRNIKEILHDHL